MKSRKAQVAHELLQAEAGIEEPLPGEAGDDEGHRVGVEKDRAEHAFAADLLVDEDGEQEAEDQAAGDEQHAEDERCSRPRSGSGRWRTGGCTARGRPSRASAASFELVNDSRTVQSMQPI